MDDPVLVEAEEDDFWFRGFNMRTGERGVFPAFYAHAVPGPAKDLLGEAPFPRGVLSSQTPLACLTYAPCHPLREQAGSLLGGALRRPVPGLRGGTLSPGQRYPLCSHAEGQSGGGRPQPHRPAQPLEAPGLCLLPQRVLEDAQGPGPPPLIQRPG